MRSCIPIRCRIAGDYMIANFLISPDCYLDFAHKWHISILGRNQATANNLNNSNILLSILSDFTNDFTSWSDV